ncbi:MAG: methylmalonyl-CoA epimerase [Acidobacteriaceae bacterium]|nr:methylmalonyl-CoA epimerase [Acidobacteriaceae bacterium]MBV9937373.1 methylmalonyl-CoA epimerase [Acidobacteriaceae bacterium]
MNFEIDHLGIAVRSLEEGLRFYRETLGLTSTGEETIEGERVRMAMLPVGNTFSTSRIELLEGTDRESVIAQFIEKRGPGLHHIALRVDSLTAALDRLKAQGCKLLNEPRIGAGGHTYVFVHPRSTGGVLLELIQK